MTHPPHGDRPQHADRPQPSYTLEFTSTGPRPGKSRKVPIVLAAVGTLVTLGAAGILYPVLSNASASDAAAGSLSAWDIEQQRMHDQIFEWVQSKCDEARSGTQVADAGKTLRIDTLGEEDSTGADASTVTCILSRLKTPTAVISHMNSTPAPDGQQQDQWEGFTASWTYHPDHGMDLVLRKA
jgi:hypothetical protein